MDDLSRLLGDLVSIPSVNPMGRALDGPGVLEAQLTGYLEGWFRARSIPCRRVPIAAGRDNLIARFEAPRSARTLLFDVHQDTVPTDGMTIDPFDPRVEGGRLYGRGACDIKGGMAAMLTAFARLCRERPPGAASVILACTVDEEFTHIGSTHLAASGHGADLAVVAEPTRLDLVHCHKGAVRWKVRTTGVACHSSSPGLGDNAIYRMAEVIRLLAGHAAELSRGPSDPILGPPTLSVGRIEGGVSVNVVPDRCAIEIDRRLIPGEAPAGAIEQVRRLLRPLSGPGGDVLFDDPWVTMPALVPNLGDWAGPLGDAVAAATGRRPELLGVPYGTDAGPLGERGLPCVVFGPGDIAQAHTKDEWIELEQVRLAAEAYYRIACDLG
ncbi:Acetylornithine deacetylase [Aquisphaera giovannonii]|uniref:Acetylornithine deacetylase n=1 Tax=Aquisphaera giovannonii TaxID=406548 RepID=A0A5B9VZW1_9BACT|nr:M20 family metallopeptidase [Aquisphaera giovannonii]QEH33976.1 Acetylornithine deacetylase [Aquisphaera giovannonii]